MPDAEVACEQSSIELSPFVRGTNSAGSKSVAKYIDGMALSLSKRRKISQHKTVLICLKKYI